MKFFHFGIVIFYLSKPVLKLCKIFCTSALKLTAEKGFMYI